MTKSELYQNVSSKKAKGVVIKRSLCFYNPTEVLAALEHNDDVRSWLSYVGNHYIPPTKDILLVYPCSTEKPYHKSRSYRQLFDTLSRLGPDRKRIHLMTISEPFGLVPEEFYATNSNWYDCPGLFQWWCAKYRQRYSKEDLNRCIEILAFHVARFLTKAKRRRSYKKMLAFVRTWSSSLQAKDDHTHRRILQKAASIADVRLEFCPRKRVVRRIVRKNGRLAWDMLGVAHPLAQEHLLNHLRKNLREVAELPTR